MGTSNVGVSASAIVAGVFLTSTAFAQSSIKDCDSALVKATYNKISRDFVDWRMAEHVDQGTYNQIKNEAGASAVIYGFPVGANYGKFQQNVQTLKRDASQSYTREQFLNVSWTGLDPASSGLYAQCLQIAALALRKPILFISQGGTNSDISFRVVYTVSGMMPNPVKVTWQGAGASNNSLPEKLHAGENGIVVPRPTVESTLVVNSDDVGSSELIVLTPLPAPLPPESKFASTCNITQTELPLPQFGRGGSTTWSCLPMRGGQYRATAEITPTSPTGAMLRVGYTLGLVTFSGQQQNFIGLPKAADPIDINANAGLSHTFASYGSVVRLPQGSVLFKLTLDNAFDHHNFAAQTGAPIQMPPNVALKLERVSD